MWFSSSLKVELYDVKLIVRTLSHFLSYYVQERCKKGCGSEKNDVIDYQFLLNWAS